MSSIDPVTMAQTLVAAERANMDSLLKSQGTKIKNQSKGLDTLKTQLSTFQTLLKDLNSTSTLQAQNSTLSQEGFMTVSSNGKAISGQYSLFVRQLAQSHQLGVKFSSETEALPSDGTLSLTVDGKEMKLDFASLPANATVKDLVSQINGASNNPGVKASLVRSNGEVNLVLTSTSSGTTKAIGMNFTSGGTVASDALAGKFATATEITPNWYSAAPTLSSAWSATLVRYPRSPCQPPRCSPLVATAVIAPWARQTIIRSPA